MLTDFKAFLISNLNLKRYNRMFLQTMSFVVLIMSFVVDLGLSIMSFLVLRS